MLDRRAVTFGRDAASLTLQAPEPTRGPVEFVTVRLLVPGLAGAKRVYLYHPGKPSLSAYFAALAADWRGWDGAREWTAIEGEFDLSSRHDGIGQVFIRVRLRGFPPSGDPGGDWQVSATIAVEPGQLAHIADGVADLLADG